jgi:hypothetical protein
MQIARRVFVVLLGNNNHGKTHLVNALLSQGLGEPSPGRKGRRQLWSPWGRSIDALVFVRSFQETEKNTHETVLAALEAEDPSWNTRDLILMPSHLEQEDVREMIGIAHQAGLDAIAASICINDHERPNYALCWTEHWNERWTIPNRQADQWESRVEALGRDLWTRICHTIGG